MPKFRLFEDNGREVDVAAGRVDEVVAADRDPVAVAHDRNDVELRVEGLDARGVGQGAAVGRVQGVGDHVVVHFARAADAGHDDRVGRGEVELLEGPQQGPEHGADAAARTPHVREDPAFQVSDSRCV
jgi:hypothetical protein